MQRERITPRKPRRMVYRAGDPRPEVQEANPPKLAQGGKVEDPGAVKPAKKSSSRKPAAKEAEK